MSKPVAWMDYLEHSDVYDLNVSGRGIPLYTHPVKQLSDEDIRKAFNEWLKTDEGVVRFDMQLNSEWIDEQWQRWKQAFKEITE